MRDNQWLKSKLESVFSTYFSDVARPNHITIHFGRKAKRRLASIRQLSRTNKYADTEIRMTGYFRDPSVPESVIEVTIAHELCHYAHGFGSPLPKFSEFPHSGGIVDKELCKRGLSEMLREQKKWLERHWNTVVGEKIFHPRVRRPRRPAPARQSGFIKVMKALGF